MRTNTFITDLWARGGPYIGDSRPHGRVTVQRPWPDLSGDHKYDVLRTTYDVGVGNYADRGLPLRWFQKSDNSQPEFEVPNVRQIHTTRSIESDAATFEVTIENQKMYDNGEAPVGHRELGQPGYFSFNRGVSPDSQARWEQTTNEWENLLVPNAIIRTYQGYGGNNLSIEEAIVAGNIMLTGIWMIDHVEISSDGTMHLAGRDMAKLLIDQQLYMPLIPKDHYPLTYYRWIYSSAPIQAASKTTTTTTTVQAQIAPGDKVTNYETSSVDAWYDNIYGHDMLLNGHHPSEAFDGNTDTYFLGEGNSRPDAEFAINYLQATCGEAMNAVYINPWAGNYTCYVSVQENGVWQGDPNVLIYYDPSILFGTQPYAVDTGGAIPYVASFGIPWETAAEYVLPRVYHADRVRITFRDLTYTPFGPWHYRAGVREFRIRASGAASQSTTTTTSNTIQPLFFAIDGLYDPDDPNTTGYMTASNFGQVDAFGDARIFPQTGGDAPSSADTVGVTFSHTRQGYYVIQVDGRITCFGDAVFHGSPHSSGVASAVNNAFSDVVLTNSGAGYWVTRVDGTIRNYGDAVPYANVSIPSGEILADVAGLTTGNGLFLVDSKGVVSVRGAAVNYGSYSGPPLSQQSNEVVGDMVATHTGLGYWILTTAGRVETFGDAQNWGQIVTPTPSPSFYERYFKMAVAPDEQGYLLLKGDGNIYAIGTVENFGSPIPGSQGTLRSDGNYQDYTDIIRDLALWSGFLLYDESTPPNARPPVYGNLETTGAFSPEDLPTDMFDKKPVIDAMRALKEVVGYLLWVDDEGAFRFESPNWWAPGNFDDEGTHTNAMFQLDEKVTLISYVATMADDALRSLIIISSEDPDPTVVNDTGQLVAGPPNPTTITARLVPRSKKQLRGLCKPAMWVNGYFIHKEEQAIMAELIALHSWFQSRIGQVVCAANPCLQINDQVRIWERQSSESYIHYVRGVDTSMDLHTGSYTMTVSTNWLGDESSWAIQDSGTFVSSNDDDPNNAWVITDRLATVLRSQFGSSASKEFGHRLVAAVTSVAPGSQTGTGAGP